MRSLRRRRVTTPVVSKSRPLILRGTEGEGVGVVEPVPSRPPSLHLSFVFLGTPSVPEVTLVSTHRSPSPPSTNFLPCPSPPLHLFSVLSVESVVTFPLFDFFCLVSGDDRYLSLFHFGVPTPCGCNEFFGLV